MNEVVLIAGAYRPFLYIVDRETEKRLYGRTVKRDGLFTDYPSFVDHSAILKRNATERDMERIVSAKAERDRRVTAANEWYQKRMDEICSEPA